MRLAERIPRRLFLGFALALAATAAGAGEIPARDSALGRTGWKEFTFNNISPAQFRQFDRDTLEVSSKDGASMLFRETTPDEQGGRYLRWRWRVTKAVPATDLRVVGKDDRDLAIHVWFPADKEGGMFSALGRAFSKAMGAPITGKSISYIFGGQGTRGDRLANPFREGEAVYVILRPSGTALGEWFEEHVDLAEDYERAFGMAAPRPSHIAISTDSDDTDTETAGVISGLRFVAE